MPGGYTLLKKRNISFRKRLIICMLFATLLPIIMVDLIMYSRYKVIIKENTKKLTKSNLEQTMTTLDVWLDAYGDVLYQLYSNEEVINNLRRYYDNTDEAEIEEAKDNMDTQLRSFLYTKEYIMAISIVTEEGDSFFYDRITPFSSHSFWINHYSMSMKEIYDMVVNSQETTFFSTEYAKTIPSKKCYLFHMAHTLNYMTGGEKKKAALIISIDEQLLENICNADLKENTENRNFIVDKNGYIVSFPDSSYLSRKLEVEGKDEKERKEVYINFIKQSGVFDRENMTTQLIHDEKLNWDIINVSSGSSYQSEISLVQRFVVTVAVLSALIVAVIIIITIQYLMRGIDVVVENMNQVEKGATDVRIKKTDDMPKEIVTIAEHLNRMLDKVEASMESEKLLAERERVAEIAALEARINPHFLYNTLDTINWMAIDRDEEEISNAISALGKILRYGINDSNAIVSIATEMEWLRQYIYLQQTRLKDSFEFIMDIEPEVMNCRIHKLLLQPFVENSIIHGFANKKGVHRLKITIKQREKLEISIEDNGGGMKKEQVDMINSGQFQHYDDKYHIGMENAFSRIRLYYGEESEVYVVSESNVQTTVYIKLPKDEV